MAMFLNGSKHACRLFLAAFFFLTAFLVQAGTDKIGVLSGYYDRPGNKVVLAWTTPAFSGAADHLVLYRKELHADFSPLTNLALAAPGFTDGAVAGYKYYFYKIATVTLGGVVLAESEIAEVTGSTNGEYEVFRFIDNTASLSASGSISFYINVPADGRTTVSVFSPDQGLVQTLKDENLKAGAWPFTWDCRNSRGESVIPGLYVISVGTTAGRSSATVMVLP